MNIFDIEKEFLAIQNELEENYGEITEELQERLAINEANFKDKVKSLTDVVKSLKLDIKGIEEETNRLRDLKIRKKATIDKIETILTEAITSFGDTSKTGSKFVDFGTGKVSIRKSEAVEVNDELLDYLGDELLKTITFNKQINTLEACDRIDLDQLVEEYNDTNNVSITDTDLDNVQVDLEVTVPLSALGNGSGYSIIKEIAKYTDNYSIDASVSKSELKSKLKENGACTPNLAKIKINNNVIIS